MKAVRSLTVVLGLALLVQAGICFAQGQGGQGGQRNRFGPRGMQGMTTCQVTRVDVGKGAIYVSSDRGDVNTIVVGKDIPIYVQTQASVSELKVGDRLYISGTPTAIIASSIEGQKAGTEAKLREVMTAGTPDAGAQPNPPANQPQPDPVIGLVGDVVSLSPLTIELANKKKTEIVTGEKMKVTVLVAATLDEIKTGTDIVAFGPNDSGTVKATLVYQGDTQSIFRAWREFMGQRFGGRMGPGGMGPGGRGPGGGPGGGPNGGPGGGPDGGGRDQPGPGDG